MKRADIINRLHGADRAWLTACAGEKFVSILKYFFLAALLLLVADLIFQLGSIPRLILGIGFSASVVALIIWFFYAAFLKTSPHLRIARLLEDRDESLGSKLINILQMDDTANDNTKSDLTRSLAHRAIDEATAEIGNRDFVSLTKSPTIWKTCKRATVPAMLFFALVLGFFSITRIPLIRYIDPFGDHPAFALTQLEIVTPSDDRLRVIYGESTSIEANYSGHRPSELFLSVTSGDGETEVLLPMFPAGENRFVQQIDSVTDDLKIRAQTRTERSVSTTRNVGVILNPQIVGAGFRVTPPEYTRIKSRKLNLALEKETSPSLSVLRGSELEFFLQSNRPLSDGAISLKASAPEPSIFSMKAGKEEKDGENQTASAKITATESGRLIFDMRDETGLSTDRELAANLVVTHDLPPAIEITQPGSDGIIVNTFTAKIVFHADDDYGLTKMRIHLSVGKKGLEGKEIDFTSSDPPLRDAKEVIEVNPREMICIPGDIISIFADVTDNRPEPQLSKTRVLKLEVVSEEQYNDYLRLRTEIGDLKRKYSDLQNQVKDLAEIQRELAKEAEELAAKIASAKEDELSESAKQKLRDELGAKQSRLNSKLNKLADAMENSTRENPLYDMEKDLQKILDQEAKKIRESAAQNQEQLQNFMEQQASDSSMEDFEKQANEQADRLDPARQTAEKQMAEALDDAQKMQDLLKALNAFQRAYQAQTELCKVTGILKDKEETSREDRLTLQQLAGEELAIGEVIKAVVEQLREGAEKAKEAFPESAQDATKIADAIEKANLTGLTGSASRTMLSGKAAPSDSKAQRVKDEMEKLSSTCSQCQGGMGSEFSQRLKLMRQMAAGNTFSQMMKSQRFSMSLGQGFGMQGGGGVGFSGMNGGGMPMEGSMDNMSMLGGASDLLGSDVKASDAQDGNALSERPLNADLDKADGKGSGGQVQRSIRPSKSATGGITIDEYKEVVDAYFRKLTMKKGKNEKKEK